MTFGTCNLACVLCCCIWLQAKATIRAMAGKPEDGLTKNEFIELMTVG